MHMHLGHDGVLGVLSTSTSLRLFLPVPPPPPLERHNGGSNHEQRRAANGRLRDVQASIGTERTVSEPKTKHSGVGQTGYNTEETHALRGQQSSPQTSTCEPDDIE
jgi:hypothetical protein